MKIKHLMHRGDTFVQLTDSISDAISHYLGHESNCVPVVDTDNKPVGILTIYRVVDYLRKGGRVSDSVSCAYLPDIQSVNQELNFEEVRDMPLERLLVLDNDGKLVGVLSKIELINRILVAFDQTAQELETLIMAVPLGIVATDADGRVTEVNRAAEKLLGRTRKDLLGAPCAILGDQGFPAIDPRLGIDPCTVSLPRSRCILQARPFNRQGQGTGCVVIFQDISEFESQAKELDSVRTLLSELDAIMATIPHPLFVLSTQGEEIFVNEKAREMFPSVHELLHRKNSSSGAKGMLSELIHGTLQTRQGTAFSKVVQTGDGQEFILNYSPVHNKLKDTERHVFYLQDISEISHMRRESQQQKYELMALRRHSQDEKNGFIHRSKAMADIIMQAQKMACVQTTVLLLGESGVGKGKVANYIHMLSTRSDGPFLTLNCGAIPESLLESELFGYEKGAFTGAGKSGKIGIVEAANHGTLFLDEVGELPLQLQVKLLHFLQDSAIMRIGGTCPIPLDVRIISATNENLEQLVSQGKFRKDLYYRLNVVPIQIPSLRQRIPDILPLAHYFLGRINKKYDTHKTFSPELCHWLEQHDWPGNVRELMNFVERIAIMSDRSTLDLSCLPATFRSAPGLPDNSSIPNLREALLQTERSVLQRALHQGGSLRSMARNLGLSHATLLRKLGQHGLSVQK